jgi:hypothetical protein
LDDIVEITEHDYFQTLFNNGKHKLAKIKEAEIDDYKIHGFLIKYYYNNTKQFMYYELFQRNPIGYKVKGDNR